MTNWQGNNFFLSLYNLILFLLDWSQDTHSQAKTKNSETVRLIECSSRPMFKIWTLFKAYFGMPEQSTHNLIHNGHEQWMPEKDHLLWVTPFHYISGLVHNFVMWLSLFSVIHLLTCTECLTCTTHHLEWFLYRVLDWLSVSSQVKKYYLYIWQIDQQTWSVQNPLNDLLKIEKNEDWKSFHWNKEWLKMNNFIMPK